MRLAEVSEITIGGKPVGYAMRLGGAVLETWCITKSPIDPLELIRLKAEADGYCDLYNCLESPPPRDDPVSLAEKRRAKFSLIDGGRR
jgi:hypothetical protein